MQFKSILAVGFTVAATANAAYVNFFGGEDCANYFQTVNIPTGCSNLNSPALAWEIYESSSCTVTVYQNANCQGALSPSQTRPNLCYDSPVQIKSVKATC
ncbi:hypothetical protein GGS26DRAFT_590322 [Hypomontagnella submonticulosa]|nr:hypothetical protein GGS26DRAFT_590322 [Hypomontagnella submonticulosa]